MKTTMIARCVFAGAAIFAAAGLIGCGAEGSGEPGAVGESSQALHGTSPTDTASAGAAMTYGRQYGASCVINDNGVSKILYAGGFDSSSSTNPAASAKIEVFTPSTGAWAVALVPGAGSTEAVLGAARGFLKGATLPGNNTKCAFVGGSDKLQLSGSTTSNRVDLVSVDANGRFTVTNPGNLAQARAHHELAVCNDKLMVIGGTKNVSGIETAAGDIEVSNVALSSWTSKANIGDDVKDFAFSADPAFTGNPAKFVIAGGAFAVSGESSQIQLIETSTDNGGVTCNTVTVTTALDSSAPHAAKPLPAAIEGARLIPDGVGSSSTFVRVAGYANGLTPKLTLGTTTIAVDWANKYVTLGTGISLTVGSYLPAFVTQIADAGHDKASILVGGDTTPTLTSNSSVTATAGVQEYQTAETFVSANEPTAARSRASAEMIDSTVYVVGGGTVASGTLTPITSADVITP